MKRFLWIVLAIMLLTSCNEEEDVQLQYEDFVGTWITKVIDGKSLETDNYEAMMFQSNKTESFGKMYDGVWTQIDGYTADLKENVLVVSKNDVVIEMEIISFVDDTLVFSSLIRDTYGIIIGELSLISTFRTKTDCRSELLGTWIGGFVGQNGEHQWIFNNDGTYTYCHEKDANGKWIVKTDNNGVYHVYGNMVVCTFDNDTNDNTIGRKSECFIFTIVDNKMNWKATRNNETVELSFKKQ